MTTLHEAKPESKLAHKFMERRAHRRADLEQQGVEIERWDGARRVGRPFGKIVDISAGGVRIRTDQLNVKADNQIRLRVELPEYAGISAFIDSTGPSMQPKREWVGWLAVTRVEKVDAKHVDVAGKLVDMDDLDRGMLGLYLSTQPIAA
jgi:hypothetical protein